MNDARQQTGLEILLAELESHQLVVELVPQKVFTNHGGMIRVAFSKNATWYRHFCARHLSSRRRNHRLPDTRIKRRAIVRILERMVAGRPTRSKYADELRREALRLVPALAS